MLGLAVVMALVLAGCGKPGEHHARAPMPPAGPIKAVTSYGVQVTVPAGWGYDYAVSRPDCITRDGDYAHDSWAVGVPRAPYVQIGLIDRVVLDIACMPKLPKDLPKVFGALPFDLWQPYVELDRRDLALGADGSWSYRGWTLTRATVGRASISVLAPPASPSLGEQVLASARKVRRDQNGCTTRAPGRLTRSHRPSGDPVPPPRQVTVAVCSYDRTVPGRPLLAASRLVTGKPASALVRAIRSAPSGGGQDRPSDCMTSMHGDQALVLHFRVSGGSLPSDPQAYVYSDWCVGNGIFTSTGRFALTRADCLPLYAEPPVRLWSTQGNLAPLCMR
ncbi:hypothetical protein GCM10027076_26730 [Nocardioides montaniterrae]